MRDLHILLCTVTSYMPIQMFVIGMKRKTLGQPGIWLFVRLVLKGAVFPFLLFEVQDGCYLSHQAHLSRCHSKSQQWSTWFSVFICVFRVLQVQGTHCSERADALLLCHS